jgi:hypothetical protein
MPNLYRLREYAESMEEQEPLLFLPCGHCYTLSSLDGHVHLSDYYTHNETEPPGMSPHRYILKLLFCARKQGPNLRSSPVLPTLFLACSQQPLYFSCPTILKAVDSSEVNKKHLNCTGWELCPLPDGLTRAPVCPDCRAPFGPSDIRRYGRPIKKALLDHAQKK